jgi:hypothetical protein
MSITGAARLEAVIFDEVNPAKRKQGGIALRGASYRDRIGSMGDPDSRVAEYDTQMQRLSSLHAQVGEAMDWESLIRIADAPEPKNEGVKGRRARQQLDSYLPSLLDYLLMRAGKARVHLQQLVVQEKLKDEKDHDDALRKWKAECARNQLMRSLAKGVVGNDENSWLRVIDILEPLKGLYGVAESANIHWDSPALAEVTLRVTSDEVVPELTLSLTKRGQVSEKPMAQKKRWEMYEDVICGAAIRATRELFAVLPFAAITIHCTSGQISSETGAVEETPVLSIHYPRKEFLALIFENIDPSDSLRRFRHNKDFKRGEGFRAVERISIANDIA